MKKLKSRCVKQQEYSDYSMKELAVGWMSLRLDITNNFLGPLLTIMCFDPTTVLTIWSAA
jgi:hypothetical protein